MYVITEENIDIIDSLARHMYPCQIVLGTNGEVTAREAPNALDSEGIWLPRFISGKIVSAWVATLDTPPDSPMGGLAAFLADWDFSDKLGGTLEVEDSTGERWDRLQGKVVTDRKLLEASLKASDHTILIDEDGDLVEPGSWNAENLPTARAWVDFRDEPMVQRLLGLVPHVVTVHRSSAFPVGSSIFDGVTAETADEIRSLGLEEGLREALEDEHLAAWKVELLINGFRPHEVSDSQINNEIARGSLSQSELVDWSELGEEFDPYWQEAWELVETEAIARRIIDQNITITQ